jgi:hypothetical protein
MWCFGKTHPKPSSSTALACSHRRFKESCKSMFSNYLDFSITETSIRKRSTTCPHGPQPIRFVDCGAYNGDTLHSLLSAGYKLEAVAAFEPDQDNFRKLSGNVVQNREKLPDTSLFPCRVYSSTTQTHWQEPINS